MAEPLLGWYWTIWTPIPKMTKMTLIIVMLVVFSYDLLLFFFLFSLLCLYPFILLCAVLAMYKSNASSPSEPIWAHLNPSEPIWTHLSPSKPIRCIMTTYQQIRTVYLNIWPLFDISFLWWRPHLDLVRSCEAVSWLHFVPSVGGNARRIGSWRLWLAKISSTCEWGARTVRIRSKSKSCELCELVWTVNYIMNLYSQILSDVYLLVL